MNVIHAILITFAMIMVVVATHILTYKKGYERGQNSCKEMSRLMQELVDIHERIEDREMLNDWEY